MPPETDKIGLILINIKEMVFGEMVTVIESSLNLIGKILGPFFPESHLYWFKPKKKQIFQR